MRTRRALKWLYDELPILVEQGVVPAQTAEAIRAHYGLPAAPLGLGRLLMAVLGAGLLGAGIILLLAHNWEQLSRAARSVVAFMPLLIGQLALGWALVARRNSVAWREGGAAFLVLAIGAAIALIGQTYHLPADMAGFLLTWLLLALPLVYLAGSSAAAVLSLLLILGWVGHSGAAYLFWPLLALLFPHLYAAQRQAPSGARSVMLRWAAGLCLLVGTGLSLKGPAATLWLPAYAALLSALYLGGRIYLERDCIAWARPFSALGAAGTALLGLVLTYRWPWRVDTWLGWRRSVEGIEALAGYGIVAGLLLLSAWLCTRAWQRRQYRALALGAAGPLAAAVYVAVQFGFPLTAALAVFNLYLLALGWTAVATGLREGNMGPVHAGSLLIAALVLARFFDADLSFLLRGLGFIGIGGAFLLVNAALARRARAVA
jgi:uncharacterized membrane protein